MTREKENMKKQKHNSSKNNSKTCLKDVNWVFRGLENKKIVKNNEINFKVTGICEAKSLKHSTSNEPFDEKVESKPMAKLNDKIKTNKKKTNKIIRNDGANQNDLSCIILGGKSFPADKAGLKQPSDSRKKASETISLHNVNSDSVQFCETILYSLINSDNDQTSTNNLISNFCNLNLSKDKVIASGTKGYKERLPDPTLNDSVEDAEAAVKHQQRGIKYSSIHVSCYENEDGVLAGNIDISVKRKSTNDDEKFDKNLKKKREDSKETERPRNLENYLYTQKRKSEESHDIHENEKKSKCETSVGEISFATLTENSLEMTRIETNKTEQNIIFSSDLITVVNKILYNDHDTPSIKFYSGVFMKCASQPSACKSNHSDDNSSEIDENKAFTLKSLMKANLWASAFNSFYTFLTSEDYLTTSHLRLLFFFIMTTNDTLLMNNAVDIITSHWDMHPPCRENMKKHYLNLLTESETADKDLPAEVSNDGLLYSILNMLESILENPEQNTIKSTATLDFQYQSVHPVRQQANPIAYPEMLKKWERFESLEEYGINKEIFGQCFEKKLKQEAEMETEEEEKMQYLTHSEQVERLILALRLIIELMEQDMAVWLVKHGVTPFKYVRQNASCPLAGRVFKTTTKQVLKLYHLCNQIEHSRVLARFIGLLAEVARVSEIQDIEGKGFIQYPYFSTECHLFTEDVYLSFIKSHRTIDEKLQLLELLRPAWVKMFVANHWLNDNLCCNYGHDLETTIRILQSKITESELFKNATVGSSSEADTHMEKTLYSEVTTNVEKTRSKKRMVRLQQKDKKNTSQQKKTSTSDLSEEAVHILIIMTSSYLKVYCLEEIYNTLKYKDLFEDVVHNYSGQDRKGRVKLRFNYVQIVNDIQNYRELRKIIKSLCKNTKFSLLHNWLSVFCRST